MRFFTLILLALFFSCASSKYNCIDILDTKKQKVPLKYRLGKRSDKSPTNYSKEIFGSPVHEGPVLASIRETELLVPADLRKREIKLLIKEISISAASNEPLRLKSEHSVKPVSSDYMEELALKVDQDSTRQDEEFKKAKKFGIISFVTSLGGLLSTVFTPYFLLPFLIVSLFTGVTSLKHYRKTSNKDSRGFAIAGLTISSVSLLLVLVAVIYLVVVFARGNTFTP